VEETLRSVNYTVNGVDGLWEQTKATPAETSLTLTDRLVAANEERRETPHGTRPYKSANALTVSSWP